VPTGKERQLDRTRFDFSHRFQHTGLNLKDRRLWISDGHGTFKILKYEFDEMWGVHEFTTDQQGNLYTAEVFEGRPQKFCPKAGADASRLVGKQMRVAWKD
jgi:hypothetical protein